MISGFNTEFKYKEKVYHVQTEDNGLKNPNIITLLYHKGAIIFSQKTNYADLINNNDEFEETLKTMMKEQHKNMIRDVMAGKFEQDKKKKEEEQGHVEKKGTVKSLDQIILDYLELQTENETKNN